MAKTINVSFKETTRDALLYSYVKNKEEQSTWIKYAIEEKMNKETSCQKNKNT